MTFLCAMALLTGIPGDGVNIPQTTLRPGTIRYRTVATVGTDPEVVYTILESQRTEKVKDGNEATVVVETDFVDVTANGERQDPPVAHPRGEKWDRWRRRMDTAPRVPGGLDPFAFIDYVPRDLLVDAKGTYVKFQVAKAPDVFFEGTWTYTSTSASAAEFALNGRLIPANLKPVRMRYEVVYDRQAGIPSRVRMESEGWVQNEGGQLTFRRDLPVKIVCERQANR